MTDGSVLSGQRQARGEGGLIPPFRTGEERTPVGSRPGGSSVPPLRLGKSDGAAASAPPRPSGPKAQPSLESSILPPAEPLDSLRWHWEETPPSSDEAEAAATSEREGEPALATAEEELPETWSSPEAWSAYLAIGAPPAPAPEALLEVGREPAAPAAASPIAASLPEVSLSAMRKAEEVADRLERIARSLRERGPTGPLSEAASDPLAALVAGYVFGHSEKFPDSSPRL